MDGAIEYAKDVGATGIARRNTRKSIGSNITNFVVSTSMVYIDLLVEVVWVKIKQYSVTTFSTHSKYLSV